MNTILSCELQSRDSCKIGRIERHHTGEGGERNRQGGSADQEVTGALAGMLLAAAGGGAARAARRGEEGGRRRGRGEAPAHPDARGRDGEAGETATAGNRPRRRSAGVGGERSGRGAVGS